MKNKWLIILFIFFLGVILLSLLITQQNQKTISLSENEIPIVQPAEDSVLPVYLHPVSPAAIIRLPLVKRGATIIKVPAVDLEEKNTQSYETVNNAIHNVSSQNVATSTQTQDSLPVGVTKIGKRPSPKEAQEMNSSGIVMY